MDYHKMTVKCLCKIAKGTGIYNYCKLKKPDLIEALIKFDESKLTRKERHDARCEHGSKCFCRKCVGGGICVHKYVFVKNVEGLKFLFTINKRVVVRSVKRLHQTLKKEKKKQSFMRLFKS